MSSGHIRRRGKRSWEIKFDLGRDPATGKRKTQYRSFKGTKREAQAELMRLLNQANEGSYVDPTKTTVAEFLDRWERDWASANVSPKTLERYCGLIHQQIKPHLGQMCIQQLRPCVSQSCLHAFGTVNSGRVLRSDRCQCDVDRQTWLPTVHQLER